MIELLVVISIIALLLPAIGKAKASARDVKCKATLHQWSLALFMYADENDGMLENADWSSGLDRYWPQTMVDYMGNVPNRVTPKEILLCPEATEQKPDTILRNSPAYRGATYYASSPLGAFPSAEPTDYLISYCHNGWAISSSDPEIYYAQRPSEIAWFSVDNMPKPTAVPALLDSTWFHIVPLDTHTPPPFPDEVDLGTGDMQKQVLDRHLGTINGLFYDGTVRDVGLKELWKLKWHRTFDTQNAWTQAGGATPNQWPPWLRRFEAY